MKNLFFCSVLALNLSLPMAAEAAEGRLLQRVTERAPTHVNHTTSVSDSRGRGITKVVDVQRSGGVRQVETSLTGPNGEVHSRAHTAEILRDGGERITHIEGTTFQGETYTGISSAQRTEAGFNKEVTLTGPAGETRSATSEVTIDRSEGSLTKQVTVTHPNGEQSATTMVRTYNKNVSE